MIYFANDWTYKIKDEKVYSWSDAMGDFRLTALCPHEIRKAAIQQRNPLREAKARRHRTAADMRRK